MRAAFEAGAGGKRGLKSGWNLGVGIGLELDWKKVNEKEQPQTVCR